MGWSERRQAEERGSEKLGSLVEEESVAVLPIGVENQIHPVLLAVWVTGPLSGSFTLYGKSIAYAKERAADQGFLPKVWYNPASWANRLSINVYDK
jgi:hypothetical protein